jgi:hypothetical protein
MTYDQRKAAKAARRRRRNERMRITPRRLNVREDGTSVLIEAKVRGPRRGVLARAAGRASLARVGQDRLLGTAPKKYRSFFKKAA